MERMTKKTDYGYTNIPNNSKFIEPIDKLGKLEDIEEELGIDLITLFKAVSNGIWFKNFIDDEIRCSTIMCATLEFSLKGLTLLSMEMDILFYFEDYGKTWALTREELK